jgi:hypothetical protein
MDFMNLSQALRDGLAMQGKATVTNLQSQAVTYASGEKITDQSTRIASLTESVGFSATGLTISGGATAVGVEMPATAFVPVPINVTLGGVTGNFALPINASDRAADAVYQMSLTDLALNEDLWATFDPMKFLPRDPLSFTIDLTGRVVLLTDLLDIGALTADVNAQRMPVTMQDVIINDLSATGLGATLTGSGDFTLDITDTTTYDGFPRPIGQATATVTGVNGLLDKLISTGLLSTDDAMSGRLMLGMFARVVAPDQLTSTIEFTPDGQIIANGQRIK